MQLSEVVESGLRLIHSFETKIEISHLKMCRELCSQG